MTILAVIAGCWGALCGFMLVFWHTIYLYLHDLTGEIPAKVATGTLIFLAAYATLLVVRGVWSGLRGLVVEHFERYKPAEGRESVSAV